MSATTDRFYCYVVGYSARHEIYHYRTAAAVGVIARDIESAIALAKVDLNSFRDVTINNVERLGEPGVVITAIDVAAASLLKDLP